MDTARIEYIEELDFDYPRTLNSLKRFNIHRIDHLTEVYDREGIGMVGYVPNFTYESYCDVKSALKIRTSRAIQHDWESLMAWDSNRTMVRLLVALIDALETILASLTVGDITGIQAHKVAKTMITGYDRIASWSMMTSLPNKVALFGYLNAPRSTEESLDTLINTLLYSLDKPQFREHAIKYGVISEQRFSSIL